MAALATQKPSAAGVALSYAAATGGGDTFVNTGREFVHVKNASGGSINVTFTAGVANANKCSFGVADPAHQLVVAVGAGLDKLIGPFDRDRFNDPATGNIAITYSGVTSLTVAVVASA
jgi:hypothetical protein